MRTFFGPNRVDSLMTGSNYFTPIVAAGGRMKFEILFFLAIGVLG